MLPYNAQSLGFDPQHCMKQVWECIPVILVLRRRKQKDLKFKVILGYLVDLSQPGTHEDSVSELLPSKREKGGIPGVVGELSWMLPLPPHRSCVASARCFHDSAAVRPTSESPSQGVRAMDGKACWVSLCPLTVLQGGPNVMVN